MTRGGRRKAEPAPSHGRAPMLLALVAVVALAVTGAAVVFGPGLPSDGSGTAGPATTPTPSASPDDTGGQLDLSNLPVTRTIACDAVDDQALSAALGSPASSQDSYSSGERVEIAPGVTDVAHENLCSFSTADAEARLWVFAAPVSTAQARRLVRDARAAPRCTFPTDGTAFGTPGLTSVCARDGETVVTLRGLFGDAWLSCELSVTGGEAGADAVRTRTDRWCVHVATTIGARP